MTMAVVISGCDSAVSNSAAGAGRRRWWPWVGLHAEHSERVPPRWWNRARCRESAEQVRDVHLDSGDADAHLDWRSTHHMGLLVPPAVKLVHEQFARRAVDEPVAHEACRGVP